MARRKLVAGNWKMNGVRASLDELDAIAAAAADSPDVDVVICPPFTLVAEAAARQPRLPIGGQDCHGNRNGAHTGCIAAEMLADAGAALVIVGHSERRTDQHETDAEVHAKAQAATAAGLTAILCVGETATERERGETLAVVARELAQGLPSDATSRSLVIAYEPLWAVGSGRTPSLIEVAEVHAAIRAQLIERFGTEGEAVRILYGGSVTAENAADLLSVADVDGALVGGASLTAAKFVPIIAAAARVG